MPISIVTKFSEENQFRRISPIKGPNSEVPSLIWLVIELYKDIMPISIVTKFSEDLVKIARVRERTKSIQCSVHEPKIFQVQF